MSADAVRLSKSDFLTGHQCRKALWLSAFEPERFAAPEAASSARMETGLEVGRLARGLFPGGVPDPGDLAGSGLARISASTPAVFEATLRTSDGLQARIDVLARGRGGWRLIEVKSSTSVKEEHLPDVAFQLLVARSCGVEVESVEVLHLNRAYVRHGALDLGALFTSTPVTQEAEALLPAAAAVAAGLRRVLTGSRRPEVPIGTHCLTPRECGARAYCWADVPAGSVLEIYGLAWEKRFSLFDRGIVHIEDVPEGAGLPERSRRHVEARRRGEPILDRDGLREFVESLSLPVFLLDFETVSPAVPLWESSSPYDQIPFQYSLHVLRQWGSTPEHSGFLAQPGPDPRAALLESLLPATAGSGSILAYHMPFELGVMRSLAESLPGYRPEIEARLPRMDDLIRPFRAWQYWIPAMGGSFSIKSVAPALAPELGYDDLELRDGQAASLTYLKLIGGVEPTEAVRLQQSLLAYCERDTLAMVRVLEAIRQAIGAG